MIDSLIRRLAVESAEKYELRTDQQTRIEEKLLSRWSTFLAENRGELQPLVNEYIEARLALEPPTSEQVAEWAGRAVPLYQRVRANVDETEVEVREVMNARQQAQFDMERLERNLGLQAFESKLKRWSVGNFKEGEWWRAPGERRRHRAARRAEREGRVRQAPEKAAAADDDAPERVARELGAWEKYVAEFCDKYELDRSQRNAAQSMLREMTDRAEAYVQTRRERIASLEEKIAQPADADEAAVRTELEELYGPLDRMFRELDERLNKLPTPGQRRRAGEDE